MREIIINDWYSLEHDARGICQKFWIKKNGKSFMFKAVLDEEYYHFGEVLYSVVCKQLGVNCVNSEFSYYKNPADKNDIVRGNLIESYLNDEDVNAVSYLDVVEYCTIHKAPIKNFESVEGTFNAVKLYAKKKNLACDFNKLKVSLLQMAILDYFFFQTDRANYNVEFLVKDNKISLAPIYDSGMCLAFAFLNGNKEVLYKIVYQIKDNDVFLISEKEKNNYFEKDLFNLMNKNNNIKKFVENIYNIDISKLLLNLQKDSKEILNDFYFENSVNMFNNRIKEFKNNYEKFNLYNKNKLNNCEK